MLFTQHDGWLWVAIKNILLLFSTHNEYLQASLGSYLSVETNGIIVRYFNQLIQSKESVDAHFLVLMLLSKGTSQHSKGPKISQICKISCNLHTLWAHKFFLVGQNIVKWVLEMFLMNFSRRRKKKIKSIRCLNQKISQKNIVKSSKKNFPPPSTVVKIDFGVMSDFGVFPATGQADFCISDV